MMLNWFKKKNLLSVDEAALTLQLNAISGLDKPRFPNLLNDEDNNALNALIYLTRSATTIISLHIEELEPDGARRAKEILTAFEQKLFPASPKEEGLALLHEVRELMRMVDKLRTSPSTKSDAELLQQLVSWGEVWIELIPDGGAMFQKIGKLSMSLLVGRLLTDINAVDSLVLTAVYGQK